MRLNIEIKGQTKISLDLAAYIVLFILNGRVFPHIASINEDSHRESKFFEEIVFQYTSTPFEHQSSSIKHLDNKY